MKLAASFAAVLITILGFGLTASGTPNPARTTARSVFHDPIQNKKNGMGAMLSSNWAGYAVTATGIFDAAASWVQPAVPCLGNQVQQSAMWVGIDGFQPSARTVEQIGTDSDCTKGKKKTPGGPSYYAWWEMFPAPVVFLPTSTNPVFAHDVMAAHVLRSGSSFTLSLIDSTQGWTFSTTQSNSSAPASSAEWIVEAPAVCKGSSCNPAKLAHFEDVNFSGATADLTTVGSFSTNAQIDMAKGKKTIKAAASLLSGGSNFTVIWHHI